MHNWLGKEDPQSAIYWIAGKPGSGKSSACRLLQRELDPKDRSILYGRLDGSSFGPIGCMMSHFFYNPAQNVLQKSITGMLRHILHDLLEARPWAIFKAVGSKRWKAAKVAERSIQIWEVDELLSVLLGALKLVNRHEAILVLLDGLDEVLDVSIQAPELISLIQTLARTDHVKLLVSSRPSSLFEDAFSNGPHLRLHNHTWGDVSRFVEGSFEKEVVFQAMSISELSNMQVLCSEITDRANGVFLWVSLVVRDLTTQLRDGATMAELRDILDTIPTELDAYFLQIFNSMPQAYRKDASVLLQLALWHEPDFASLFGLTLLECALINTSLYNELPKLSPQAKDLDFKARERLASRLNSMGRRLRSRCQGLLEVVHVPRDRGLDAATRDLALHPGSTTSMIGPNFTTLALTRDDSLKRQKLRLYWSMGLLDVTGDEDTGIKDPPSTVQINLDDPGGPQDALHYHVSFLHRSVRDFLLTPAITEAIHNDTGGPLDVRSYFCEVRLQQLLAAQAADFDLSTRFFLASHVVCALATHQLRNNSSSVQALQLVEPVLREAARAARRDGFYISPSVYNWTKEHGSLLSFSIDLNISAYYKAFLNEKAVKKPEGRPLLDHVLRPRFLGTQNLGIGLSLPSVPLVKALLESGADPNQIYNGCTLWTRYLCLTRALLVYRDEFVPDANISVFVDVMTLLIWNGASHTIFVQPGHLHHLAPGKHELWEDWYRSQRMEHDLFRTDSRPRSSNDSFFRGELPYDGNCHQVADLLDQFPQRVQPQLQAVKIMLTVAQHTVPKAEVADLLKTEMTPGPTVAATALRRQMKELKVARSQEMQKIQHILEYEHAEAQLRVKLKARLAELERLCNVEEVSPSVQQKDQSVVVQAKI